MNKTAISFCLPVYNVAPYIEDCILSIIEQKLDSYEILCIDDCSTDTSLQKLQQLAETHPEIRIIVNDKNHGVSYTRNRCIQEACGEYIWFIDPDDVLPPGTATYIYEAAIENKADIVRGNYLKFKDGENWRELFPSVSGETKPCCEASTELPVDAEGTKMSAVWCGVYKRDFLTKNKLSFNERMVTQEDTLFFWDVALCEPACYKCRMYCYLYRQRATSVMHTHNESLTKKNYATMHEMLRVYTEQLKTVAEKRKPQLRTKIHHSLENISLMLMMSRDTPFVRRELQKLKEERLYPYKFRPATLKNHFPLCLARFVLPIEPFFWVLHCSHKLYFKLRHGRKGH